MDIGEKSASLLEENGSFEEIAVTPFDFPIGGFHSDPTWKAYGELWMRDVMVAIEGKKSLLLE
jgi:hypothetical protein